jgi:hypothetical protein
MTATLILETPVEHATREPLIELESVVKIYRTGSSSTRPFAGSTFRSNRRDGRPSLGRLEAARRRS